MKKFVSVFLAISLLTTLFSATVFATLEEPPSVAMAINQNVMYVNGTRVETSAPMLVFGKTFVDLYAVAPFFGLDVSVFEGGYKVESVDFTPISQWIDLTNLKNKYFEKDFNMYVSLRELTDLAGLDITYKNGIINVGFQDSSYDEIYGTVDTYSSDDYVRTEYPLRDEYIVNPYQEYSYETMLQDADKLKSLYPDLIELSSIGKSVENRDLMLMKVGKGPYKIFVCGTHHAREYICTTYLMYAIDRYAHAYRNNEMWGKYDPKFLLDNVTFYIVPMVNPDGVNLVLNGVEATQNPEYVSSLKIYEGAQYGYSAWKANVNGVDLNWNYDKDWSIEKNDNPRGSSGFRGDRPHTEPETIAVSEYVDNNPFDAYLSFHTQGEIFYWADNKEDPYGINVAVKNDTGFLPYYDNGTGIGGSFFDYVYRKFNKPTLTLELCPYVGNYPYPVDDFDTVWKPSKNILLVVANELLYQKSLR